VLPARARNELGRFAAGELRTGQDREPEGRDFSQNAILIVVTDPLDTMVQTALMVWVIRNKMAE
jgi:hypothetical protein